jgi:hypothetical protein
MSSLCIVVGYDGTGASARPFLVYLGRDGSAGEAAMGVSNAVRFEVFKQAVGLRKHNARHDGSKPATALVPGEATVKALRAVGELDEVLKAAVAKVKAAEGGVAHAKDLLAARGAEASAADVQAGQETVTAAEAVLAVAQEKLKAASAAQKRAEEDAAALVKADKARGVKVFK